LLFSLLKVPFYSSAAPTVYIEIEADLLCPQLQDPIERV
jgi:hypothetical protein